MLAMTSGAGDAKDGRARDQVRMAKRVMKEERQWDSRKKMQDVDDNVCLCCCKDETI